MPEQMLAPEDKMMQWITSKWITKPIYVITELGIADILRDGPLSVDDLAEKTDTHASTLFRILRALSSVGVFVETEDRVFGLTQQEGIKGRISHPRLPPYVFRSRGDTSNISLYRCNYMLR